MISGAHTASAGEGGREGYCFPAGRVSSPTGVFSLSQREGVIYLAASVLLALSGAANSSTRCAAGTGSLLLFKRLFQRQCSCAPSKSCIPGPASSGECPPWAAHHLGERGGQRTGTCTMCTTGLEKEEGPREMLQTWLPAEDSVGLHRLQDNLFAFPLYTKTALTASGCQPSSGLQHNLTLYSTALQYYCFRITRVPWV